MIHADGVLVAVEGVPNCCRKLFAPLTFGSGMYRSISSAEVGFTRDGGTMFPANGCPVSGSRIILVNCPRRSSEVGTRPVTMAALEFVFRCRSDSKPKKKNVRFCPLYNFGIRTG